MKLKDCRILWNLSTDHKKIIDIEIHEFIWNGKCFPNSYLHKNFRCDEGNANSDWKDWTLEEVLVKFFIGKEFENEEIKDKFINELLKIDEFKNKYKHYTKKHKEDYE